MSEAGFSQNVTTERGLHSDVNAMEGLSEQFRSDETRHAETIGRNRVNKLKVLHVAATASGASWMVDILRGLRSRGYEVSALISGAQGDLAPKLKREGIPYYVGELDLFSNPALAVPKTLRLANFLRKHQFDIVHYHLFASVISGRIAAYLADVPLRYSMITGPYHLEAPTPSRIDCKTVWMDTKVIASCEYTRQLYRSKGVPWNRIERIYYGADESRFDPATSDASKLRRELGIPKGTPVVGMVAYFYAPLPKGSWTPPHLQGRALKGHETLLQAARIVLKKNPRTKFVLVGKGWGAIGEEYETQLRTSAREMGVDKSVIFAGARTDVPDALASFDVSVQCSLNENLGGTIESLLMARPTIATAVGGMPDSVRDWQTGLLVPPDDKDELAKAILTLLNNRRRARLLGQNGRRLMLREFTLTRTVDDIDRLYQSSAREEIPQDGSGPTELNMHYYRSYRILCNFCVLAVVLPIVFLPIFIRQLIGPFQTAAATLVALLVWTFVRFARRNDPEAKIFSLLRRTQPLIPPLQKILVHAHIGRLDFSGLTGNLDAMARRAGNNK
jgi:glycosyltransferase involved in cell wall biosynthesis